MIPGVPYRDDTFSLTVNTVEKFARLKISMNGWMGPNAPAWNPGYTIFAKAAQLT